DAGAMKPIETGVGPGGPADAIALRRAAGERDPLADVCPQSFALGAAPAAAARAEGRALDLGAIDAAYSRLRARRAFLVVEGAGGLLVPVAAELSMADLARRFELPLLVVCRAALGTIHHTRLTPDAARTLARAGGGGSSGAGVVTSSAGGALTARDVPNREDRRGDLGGARAGEMPPLGAGELPAPEHLNVEALISSGASGASKS